MESYTTHKLNIERDHVPDYGLTADFQFGAAETAAGVLHCGESLAHERIERFTLGVTLFELSSLCFELLF